LSDLTKSSTKLLRNLDRAKKDAQRSNQLINKDINDDFELILDQIKSNITYFEDHELYGQFFDLSTEIVYEENYNIIQSTTRFIQIFKNFMVSN
jgi:hypothetical protein